MKKSELKALERALKLPEIQSHLRRKKAAWKDPNPSQEIIYQWVQHRLAQTLYSDLMKWSVSALLPCYKTRPFKS